MKKWLLILLLILSTSYSQAAVTNWGGNKYTGLSSDTKPATAPNGSTFYETDTSLLKIKVSGSWQEIKPTALYANGTNCTTGQYPLGVDASGNVESCTAVSASSGDIASVGTCTTGACEAFDITGDFQSPNVTATTKVTSPFYRSNNADPADAGQVRLGNTETIAWELATPGTDKTLGVDASDILQFNGTVNATGLTVNTVSVATLSGSETLTNKTLTTPIISSISNSGTVTLPTGTVTLSTLTGTETLTNKTLTTPKIATTDSIVDAGGDEYLNFVEAATPVTHIRITSGNTTVAPQVSGVGETNTDIHIHGTGTGNTILSDGTDTTKKVSIEVSGATTGTTTTIASSQTADRTLTLPDSTGTLATQTYVDNQSVTLENSADLMGLLSDGTGDSAGAVSVFNISPVIITSLTVNPATSPDPADAGAIRLNNADSIAWEASPAGTDVTITVDSSEIVQIAGGTLDGADLTTGSVTATQLGADSVANSEIGDDAVGAAEVDWGTGANQIDASDIPFTPSGTLDGSTVAAVVVEAAKESAWTNGKTFQWFGTSIPATDDTIGTYGAGASSYPKLMGTELGVTVTNSSLGGQYVTFDGTCGNQLAAFTDEVDADGLACTAGQQSYSFEARLADGGDARDVLVLDLGWKDKDLTMGTPEGTATAISAITLANPAVITATAHGLNAGDAFCVRVRDNDNDGLGMKEIHNWCGYMNNIACTGLTSRCGYRTDADTITTNLDTSSGYTALDAGDTNQVIEYDRTIYAQAMAFVIKNIYRHDSTVEIAMVNPPMRNSDTQASGWEAAVNNVRSTNFLIANYFNLPIYDMSNAMAINDANAEASSIDDMTYVHPTVLATRTLISKKLADWFKSGTPTDAFDTNNLVLKDPSDNFHSTTLKAGSLTAHNTVTLPLTTTTIPSFNTMTDTKTCTYEAASGINCNTTPSGSESTVVGDTTSIDLTLTGSTITADVLAVTDAMVPNTITIDNATTAATANAGDSATAFFSSGAIEDAYIPDALTFSTLTGANGETITNPNDNEIKFTGLEDLTFDFNTSNQVTLETDTGVTVFQFGNIAANGTFADTGSTWGMIGESTSANIIPNFLIRQYNNGVITSFPSFGFNIAGGSLATPAATPVSQPLGRITFKGHDGTAFRTGVTIDAITDASDAWGSSTNIPTDLKISIGRTASAATELLELKGASASMEFNGATIGTSGVGVIAVANGTAPATVTNQYQTWSENGEMHVIGQGVATALGKPETKCSTISYPTTSTDYMVESVNYAITIRGIRIITNGGGTTSVTADLEQCYSSSAIQPLCNANTVVETQTHNDGDTIVTDVTISGDATVPATTPLWWDLTTVTNTPNHVMLCIDYTVD